MTQMNPTKNKVCTSFYSLINNCISQKPFIQWKSQTSSNQHIEKISAIKKIFTEILKLKNIQQSPETVIKLLHNKYLKQSLVQNQNKLFNQAIFQLSESDSIQNKRQNLPNQITDDSIKSIIDLQDEVEQLPPVQKKLFNQKNFNKNIIVNLDQDDQSSEKNQLNNRILNFPIKTIQNQTGRSFFLLEDPFVPKTFVQDSLINNYIEFRNENFSDTMPVSRAQQRKGGMDRQFNSYKQNIEELKQHFPDSCNHSRYQKDFPSMEKQFLWKNRMKPDVNYLVTLAQVWTLEESCMTKKKQLIKRFHQEREIAKTFINYGYGVRIARSKIKFFYDEKTYHKAVYTIVRQAFRCIEEDLIVKYNKPAEAIMFKYFRKVMCFLANFHDSFKVQEMKQIFIEYVKIAYKIQYQPLSEEQTICLYNFILKDVLPEQEYDSRIICLD